MIEIVLGCLLLVAGLLAALRPMLVVLLPQLLVIPPLGTVIPQMVAGAGLVLILAGLYRRLPRSGPRDLNWLRTATVTGLAVLTIALVAFAAPLLAAPLDLIKIGGFPLGFYMAAQGSLILIAVVAFVAARRQEALDEDAARGASDDPFAGGLS